MLNKTDQAILLALTQGRAKGQLLRVDDVARTLKVSAGLVSQRLRRMEREGLVARTQKAVPEGRVVHYLPLAWASISWNSPTEGVFREWFSHGELDWDFPLISQVPDSDARTTVRSFLAKLEFDGLLHARHGFKPAWSKLRESDYHGLTLIAYGSTARGKARPGADVDLIGFHREHRQERLKRIEDLAAETSLEGRRSIHLALLDWDQRATKLPPWISDAIESDGKLLFDGLRQSDGTRVGAWRLVGRGGKA